MAKAKARSRKSGQGSVFQRKDGRWGWGIAHGYNEAGNPKRHQGIAATREAAVEALNEVMMRLRLGLPAVDEKQTVGQFIEFWLAETVRGQKAPKTVRFYEQMTRLYILPALGHIALGSLSPQHVQRFLNELARTARHADRRNAEGSIERVELPPISPTTVSHVRAVLRAALQTAWMWSLVRENVARKVKLPSKAAAKEPIFLTPEEASALIAATAGHYLGNLIRFGLNTGLRLGEATGLAWEDVTEGYGSISVRHQLQRVEGKFVLRGLKSGSSRRRLPLTKAAMESLVEQRTNQLLWSSDEPEGFNPLGLVFTGQAGRPLDPKTIDKHLKAFADKAGIKKALSFHKLRHTAGTHLVANGVPLNVVKEILGHSQIAITANLYAHAVPAAHRTAFDALEQAYRSEE